MEILLGLILVVLLIAVLNYWDRATSEPKIEIRPSVFDGPEHPSVDERDMSHLRFAPKYKDPFIPYDPVKRKPVVMEPHDEAKDATGVSSGFGHDDYRKPKE